jgi:hypothetical protein
MCSRNKRWTIIPSKSLVIAIGTEEAMTRRAGYPMLLLLGGILSTFPSPAHANGGPVEDWGGNNIVPVNTNDVRLVREEVGIDLDTKWGENRVTCLYLLRNLVGHESRFSMSFVRGREPGREFRVWMGGRPTPVRWAPADQARWGRYCDGDLDSLPVWEVAIPADDTLSVRCSYPVMFDGGRWGNGTRLYFVYFTTSAALWAGTIERADFRIDFGDDWRLYTCDDYLVPPFVSAHIEPAGFRWDGTSVRWHFENWEPKENLKIARFDAEAFREADFIECWPMSEVDCDYLVRLPTYTSDISVFTDSFLLEAVRKGFLSQGVAEPIHENYRAYACAFLDGLRNEISARHGAAFDDDRCQRYFELQPWYRSNPSYDPSLLSPIEQANEQALLDIKRRIEEQPSLLLPLPSRSGRSGTSDDR